MIGKNKDEQVQVELEEESIQLDENGDEIGVEPEVDPLESAQAEIAELKDKVLRTHAEMDNLRKRTQREIADAHKFGVEKFATSLLDVMDNLERALAVEDGNEAAVREGIQLTLNSWHEMMTRFEVKRIDAVGELFDPHHHEALSQMPSEEPEGTVIAQHVAAHDRQTGTQVSLISLLAHVLTVPSSSWKADSSAAFSCASASSRSWLRDS